MQSKSAYCTASPPQLHCKGKKAPQSTLPCLFDSVLSSLLLFKSFFPVPLLNVVQTFFLCNLIHPIFPSPCPQALLMLSLLRLCLLSNPCFLLHITPTLRPPPIHFLPPTASLLVDAKVPLTFNATLAFMSFLSPTLITIRSQSSCCISAFVRMASFAPY